MVTPIEASVTLLDGSKIRYLCMLQYGEALRQFDKLSAEDRWQITTVISFFTTENITTSTISQGKSVSRGELLLINSKGILFIS